VLSGPQYRVIEMRFGLHNRRPHTLQEIGDKYDLTRERIRQIEENALRKLEPAARARGLGIPFGLAPWREQRSDSSSTVSRGTGSPAVASEKGDRRTSGEKEGSPTDAESEMRDGSPCYRALVGDIAPIAVLGLTQIPRDALLDAQVTTLGRLAVQSVQDLVRFRDIDAAMSERIHDKLRQYAADGLPQRECLSGPEIRSAQPDTGMATPFSTIFVDRAEAKWAFDLLRETFRILGVKDPCDERFSVGFRRDRQILRLSIGDWWGVLQFASPDWSKCRVALALIEDEGTQTRACAHWKLYEGNEGEPSVNMYRFTTGDVRPLTGRLREAYQKSFAHITERFEGMEETKYRRQHVVEIAQAVFDRERRSELLTHGIGGV